MGVLFANRNQGTIFRRFLDGGGQRNAGRTIENLPPFCNCDKRCIMDKSSNRHEPHAEGRVDRQGVFVDYMKLFMI